MCDVGRRRQVLSIATRGLRERLSEQTSIAGADR
jgi:hypothetical protein